MDSFGYFCLLDPVMAGGTSSDSRFIVFPTFSVFQTSLSHPPNDAGVNEDIVFREEHFSGTPLADTTPVRK